MVLERDIPYVYPLRQTFQPVRGLDRIRLTNRAIDFFNPDTAIFPAQDQLFSGPVQLELHQSMGIKQFPDVSLLGTTRELFYTPTTSLACCIPSTAWLTWNSTVFLNEGADGRWNGLWHYYHFAAENVLGGLAALAIPTGRSRSMPLIPDTLLIPWEMAYKDKWGMNEMVIDGVFNGSES